jgi:hypothetical protein
MLLISKQWLSKCVPAEMNTCITMKELCFLLGHHRGYVARTPGELSAVLLIEVKWSEAKQNEVKSLVNEWENLVVSWKWSLRDVKLPPAWNPVSSSVEGWQLSRAPQGRLKRDGAIVELTVDKSSDVGYLPDSNEMSAGSWRTSTGRSCY